MTIRDELAEALAEAGGAAAPPAANARLRGLLAERLRDGAAELAKPRSGYELPVCVAVAAGAGALVAVIPVDAALRADPGVAGERASRLVAAVVAGLVDAADPRAGAESVLAAGDLDGWLAMELPAAEPDADYAVEWLRERTAEIDRLRARAYALPGHVAQPRRDMRPPIGNWHPLRVAEVVARLGGDPLDEGSVEEHEAGLQAALPGGRQVARPHDDPVPERRVARRILQRMAGMGKWGGYHTAFDHLARGFEGNDRRLAQEVGERLLAAGLIAEKPSVGQRHVFLNPRRVQEINALVDDGVVPPGLDLG